MGRRERPADTEAYRSDPKTLKIVDTVDVDNVVSDTIVGKTSITGGIVTGSNLGRGDTLPRTATDGDLFQDTRGSLWIWRNGGWSRLVGSDEATPAGSITHSLADPQEMRDKGWYLLNGQTITEDVAPEMFSVRGLSKFISKRTIPAASLCPTSRTG